MVWGGRDLTGPPCPPWAETPSIRPCFSKPHPTRIGALNTSREAASTTSHLFQSLTTLIAKNFFLISNVSLLSLGLKPLPLVLLVYAYKNIHDSRENIK